MQIFSEPVNRLTVKAHFSIGMLVLVKEHSAKLKVSWERADVNFCHLIIRSHDHILDHNGSTTCVSCFVETDIELLQSETVFAALPHTLLDFETADLAIFNFQNWLESIDSA